jgi:hypothetical protein
MDLYFSPATPRRFEKNWNPTVPGPAWFTYLRLYVPTEAYFDKTWKLPDIEKEKWPQLSGYPMSLVTSTSLNGRVSSRLTPGAR